MAPVLGNALQQLIQNVGIADNTEVLLFPDDISYDRYATRAGLQGRVAMDDLNTWFYTDFLGLPRLDRTRPQDLPAYQQQYQQRLKMPDMTRNRVLFQALQQIHLHTIVKQGDNFQAAATFFGPAFFQALSLSFLASR